MGYEERAHSSSSATMVAVLIAVFIVAILGILVVVGAGLFWVRASRVEIHRAERAVAEARRAEVVALRAAEQSQLATPDPRLTLTIEVDREGNASVDGEPISLEQLKGRLAKLQNETSNAFTVYFNADPECPARHVIPLLDACEEVGDIDYRVASREGNAKTADAATMP